MVERWHQLPLDHALTRMPVVRELVQQLADETAAAQGVPFADVPDLGPAVVMDQLTVMVFDAAGAAAAHATTTGLPAARLAALRRSL